MTREAQSDSTYATSAARSAASSLMSLACGRPLAAVPEHSLGDAVGEPIVQQPLVPLTFRCKASPRSGGGAQSSPSGQKLGRPSPSAVPRSCSSLAAYDLRRARIASCRQRWRGAVGHDAIGAAGAPGHEIVRASDERDHAIVLGERLERLRAAVVQEPPAAVQMTAQSGAVRIPGRERRWHARRRTQGYAAARPREEPIASHRDQGRR